MKKLSIYLMFLFAAFLFASCGEEEEVVADEKEEEEEEIVEERENISFYGETELAFTNAAVGDGGMYEGYHLTSIFLSDVDLSDGPDNININDGDSFIAIFFASTEDHPNAIEYTEIKTTNDSSEDSMFEGGNLKYQHDADNPGPALNVESGSVNLIEYDFSAKTIEIEYEFELEDGKTSKGYFKGSFEFLGEVG